MVKEEILSSQEKIQAGDNFFQTESQMNTGG